MLKQSIIITFRNIKRNKTSFFLNLIGLSTGLACALLIYLWVYNELNVDKFHEKDSRLYQVMANYNLPDKVTTWDCTPAPLTQALLDGMPEVENAVPVCNYYHRLKGIMINGDSRIKTNGWFVGKDFFNVFSFKLIQGDNKQVLTDKNCVVISESLAKKLFKTTKNVIGRTIEWNSYWKRSFQISGIFEDPPANATTHFDFLVNFDVLLDNDSGLIGWNSEPAYAYIVLKKGTNIDHFNKKIADFIKQKPGREKFTLFVQQYSRRYLYGIYENGVQVSGRIIYVRLFIIIAIFILIIACINFMNLSTAQAGRRIKEIGVKKISGANRKDLIIQFLAESMFVAFLSLIIAITVIFILLPQYEKITGSMLHFEFNLNTILAFSGITIISGLLAGSYPAFYLSKYNPVTALKGKLHTQFNELIVRKGLVIIQFTLSVIFIVATIVIWRQIEFVNHKNLGYNMDNVINFNINGRTKPEFGTFMYELRNISGVKKATNLYCGSIIENVSTGTPPGRLEQTPQERIKTPKLFVGLDFIETLNIEILEGRSFSKDLPNEGAKIILNEAAVKMMGFNNPIGEFLCYGNFHLQIIGVVKNFHIKSLHEKIEPCFIFFDPGGRDILVKIKAGEEVATIEKIKKLVEAYQPGYPIEYTFLNDDYQALYKSENKVASLLKYFAAIAIVISCLGLFGLATYTTERRRKEIGIRKVNGSEIFEILVILNKDFIQWVAIAFIIACPVAWYAMHKWLQNFAYRTELSWWIFAIAGFVALFIAILTISWQSWRAATRNPLEALRYE
jgi:ABC-type antimicrobial peptide transport system permease subunit